jgi:hypothetical protein
MNLVEPWFAELTNRKLRRSAHHSVTDLETDIRKWIKNPKPVVWTKPLMRSSKPSPPTANASSTQDTSFRPAIICDLCRARYRLQYAFCGTPEHGSGMLPKAGKTA